MLSLWANAQIFDNKTFVQVVEKSNGELKTSIKKRLQNSDHIFIAAPVSGEGHNYLSFNSLGKSQFTPKQVINAIKTDPNDAFPYFRADGECSQKIKKGNVFSLNVALEGYRVIENPVQVTVVNKYSFTFSTLPGHTLQGSATHGICKDSSGELWLFQVGTGVLGEAELKQKLNYTIAKKMWSQMAENVKGMIENIKFDSQESEDSNDYLYRVNSYVNTEISVKKGDRISISASGTVKFGFWLAGSGGPEGISFNPAYNYFTDLLHGCLIGRIKTLNSGTRDDWFYIGIGRDIIAAKSGTLEFEVNDNQPQDNDGKFCVEVVINSMK
ncbi:hypothetical protein DTQ70_18250 [Runella sp. SP2]|nr:hypothetical protein DTQ70_18250 [Runella sp. SP2]